MLSLDEALSLVLKRARRLPRERVPLESALHRVLAADQLAPFDQPPWDNSAMDGYAVRSSDCAVAGAILELRDTIPAGKPSSQTLEPGCCARIFTGAPIPAGSDAVIKQEDTESLPGQRVRMLSEVSPRANVRPRGDSLREGQRVLAAGSRLSPACLGQLASMGGASVEVIQRPLVAVLATGDELLEPGEPRTTGGIYSSNTVMLMGMIREAGAEPLHAGIARDSPEDLEEALSRCRRADLILSTGGVSVGDFDWVTPRLREQGELDFWKVAIQPGKPLAFGALLDRPFFGLPGNPVSAAVNFLLFVRPFLRAMLGQSPLHLPRARGVLAAPLRHRPGRKLLARVQLQRGPGEELTVWPLSNQSSGVLGSMVSADALAILDEDCPRKEAGETIELILLDGGRSRLQEPLEREAPRHDPCC